MFDINFIKKNKKIVETNLKNRKAKASIARILDLDTRRKEAEILLNALRQQKNVGSKQNLSLVERNRLRELHKKIENLDGKMREIKEKLHEELSWVPNMSAIDMPIGGGPEDNVELKVWIPNKGYLESKKLGKGNNAVKFMSVLKNPLHHVELGERLDIIDVKQSAFTSGSRFAYLKKEAVLIQYALYNLLSKKLIKEGFVPMITPLMVKERVLFGTSHFPEGKDQVYKIEPNNVEDKVDLYFVGSSEPSLFAYYMDKLIPHEELPVKMFAFTSCFRSEVGSWGKDVRGIKRVHQFDKLEMDAVCLPEQAEKIMEEFLAINEWLLQALQLPYRVINKCTGDCGYLATYKQYDIEVWLPGQQEFMEVMTDTNTTDFQAQRLNIKYKGEKGKKVYAYTVNDTGCAMGRMIIAILDNYQKEDGSVMIPTALQEYIGKSIIQTKKK